MVLEAGGVMASIVCSCGEPLILNAGGVTICWFCQMHYDHSGIVVQPLDYEPQQSRAIIKSDSVPVQLVERRGNYRRVE